MHLTGILRRIGIAAAALFAIIVLAVVVAAAALESGALRGFLSRQVSALIGRDFAINGDLDLRPGRTPTVRAEQLTLANADWGSSRLMADIGVLEFRIDLWRLLQGDVVIPEITLVQPTLLLEKGEDGKANWRFGKQPQETGAGEAPQVGRLNIRDGVVFFRDPANDTFVRTDISTRQPSGSKQSERLVAFNSSGRVQGQELALQGVAGALLSLRSTTDPYPLEIRGRIGENRLTARGTLLDPLNLKGVDLDLTLEGEDIGKLGDVAGLPIPATPPYSLAGQVRRVERTWSLSEFRGALGDSKLAGHISLEPRRDRPLIHGDLESDLLDLDDLAGVIGAPPATEPGETASPEQRQEAAQAKRKRRIFPDEPYDLAHLRNVDADIRFRASRIRAETVQVQKLATRIRLDAGRLKLSPLDFTVADGTTRSEITVDAREDVLRAAANITLKGVDLHKLFPKLEVTKETVVQFSGRAALSTMGNTFADMAAAVDGELGLVISGGRVSNLLLEVAGIDGGEALLFFLGGDEDVPMRCAVAGFNIKDGVMKVDTFLIDTTDTNIIGEGRIDLGKETMDLSFRTRPKDPSLFSSRAPLYVTGVLKEPDFAVDKTRIAQRVGAAVALGVLLNPLAALIPLIETGPGVDTNCGALFAAVQRQQDSKARLPK